MPVGEREGNGAPSALKLLMETAEAEGRKQIPFNSAYLRIAEKVIGATRMLGPNAAIFHKRLLAVAGGLPKETQDAIESGREFAIRVKNREFVEVRRSSVFSRALTTIL